MLVLVYRHICWFTAAYPGARWPYSRRRAGEWELPPDLGKPVEEYVTFETSLGWQPNMPQTMPGNSRLIMSGDIISVPVIRSSTRGTRLLCWPRRVAESYLISGKVPGQWSKLCPRIATWWTWEIIGLGIFMLTQEIF